MTATVTPLRPRGKCPECKKASSQAHFPFCSPRCKAVDLNRWLSGSYVIPGPAEELSSTETDEDER